MTTPGSDSSADALSRLKRRRENDDLNFSQALSGLAGILSDTKAASVIVGKTGDSLIDATQQVLSASGFHVTLKKTAHAADPQDTLSLLARQANASLRRVALSGEAWWREDAGALLAFMKEDGKPVALLPAGERGYLLQDPASGESIRLDAENIKNLADTAFMFFRKFPQHAVGMRDLLRFGMVGASQDLLFLIGCGALGGILGLFTPFATGLLIDTVIPSARSDELIQLILLLITTALGMSAFELTRSLSMLRVQGRMGNASQAAIIDRLLHLPAAFFRQYSSGDLAQRAFSIDGILTLLTGTTQAALLSWVFGLFSFAYLFVLSGKLALLATAIVLVALLVTTAINFWRLSMERRMSALQGRIASRVLQILNGISKLCGSGAEKRAFALWARDFTQQKQLDFNIRSIANVLSVFDAAYVVAASLLLFAVIAFFQPDISTGTFMAFNAAFAQFLAATIAMSNALTASLNVIPLYERAKPILEALPEQDESQTDPGLLKGDIDISHVSFRYVEDGPAILNDISIRIREGEFVAFVGPSGSGKSTLFRMLLGFEHPESGAIYYDQRDLSGLDIGAVRRQLGVVLQSGKLMPGDIYTNIVGSAPLTLDDAWEAARMAGFDDDIKAMPMGMHTVIAEGAGTISGGQKQRLMIARAIVKKPRILLFDEATSALDNRTQAIVARSVEQLNATRIVIAHRLSTVIKADRIFVIEAGQVIESGNYEQLMAQNGHFAELAKRQLA
jgi:ATP-binding cassette subfamily C protein